MLRVENLDAFYGSIQVLKGISLEVREKESVALVGANGAGKTTLLNTISGLVEKKTGMIKFQGRNISGLPPEKIITFGIIQVPENRRIFKPLTALENLEIGAYIRSKHGEKKEILQDFDFVFRLFPILKNRTNQLAGTLSGGEQQMLSIGRALMSRPKLVLLDEPSLGLAPLVVKEILEIINTLRLGGMTVMLVEQNLKACLKVSDRVYVMEMGKIRIEGEAANLLKKEEVKKAFLGEAIVESSKKGGE
ncbi:MAG: ABC transporter ATP-binding protein [Thermodesulfobacteriota bacterium]